jgi:hypothetical protein
MDNTCLICLESNINNIIDLHNKTNFNHKVCLECFNIWYLKNNNKYNCIICKQLIDINSLPNFITKKIEFKETQLYKSYIINKPRNFKLINSSTGEYYGRYIGKTPKQAANKAFSSLLRKKYIQNNEIINFSIIECTRYSKNKIYNYYGKRELNKNQFTKTILKNNLIKEFEFKFRNKIFRSF